MTHPLIISWQQSYHPILPPIKSNVSFDGGSYSSRKIVDERC